MNLRHLFPFAMLLAMLVYACNPIEEEITTARGARLAYSQDTVIFDTIFTAVNSITKRLMIFNQNKNAINISRIHLGKGGGSEYSIIVNGEENHDFRDEVILGRDSLLVLVDVKVDPMNEDLPFIVKDSIVIESNGNREHIKLVSWGQDAVFLNGEIIECNTTWTADRPYIIYNNALVDTLCTLNVDPGARIYIDNNSSLFVKGSLKLNGTLENNIVVRNTRLDPKFDIAPGQWDGIYFLEGSHDNTIEHAVISNGMNGLRVGTPDDNEEFDVVIGNTIIEHMSTAGILAFTSEVRVYNTVIYDCGEYVIGNFLGGKYEYEHCTLVNDPTSFFREQESFQFSDNIVLDDGSTLSDKLSVKIVNSILWGNEDEEMVLSLSGESEVTIEVHDNIIRTVNPFYSDLGNTTSTESDFPGFYDKFLFDYQIDSLGNARNTGENIGIDFDILGTPRDEMPDYGAYERKDSIP
ncbi:MAG: hypothetical protein JXQ96_19335 [Cyclobacteriaceae bacterium]